MDVGDVGAGAQVQAGNLGGNYGDGRGLRMEIPSIYPQYLWILPCNLVVIRQQKTRNPWKDAGLMNGVGHRWTV